jgi:hypothetical protein
MTALMLGFVLAATSPPAHAATIRALPDDAFPEPGATVGVDIVLDLRSGEQASAIDVNVDFVGEAVASVVAGADVVAGVRSLGVPWPRPSKVKLLQDLFPPTPGATSVALFSWAGPDSGSDRTLGTLFIALGDDPIALVLQAFDVTRDVTPDDDYQPPFFAHVPVETNAGTVLWRYPARSAQVASAPIPEPSTLFLLVLGGLGAGIVSGRRRRRLCGVQVGPGLGERRR